MIRPILGIRSIAIILALGALVVIAYQNEGKSTGTTFAQGLVDITVGNESYYNGVLDPGTSWDLRDLTIEKFFNFSDVKPNDYGEDTLALNVGNEDSYLCSDVILTSNNENGCNEPEGLVDASCGNPGADEGELASHMNFIWWADDGDNVLEDGETVISNGPIGDLTLGVSTTVTLADSATNIWAGQGGPLSAGTTHYIGKAWCFGTITPEPLSQDGSGNARNPSLDNNGDNIAGTPEDGGFACNGVPLSNDSQTDSLTANVALHAVEALGNNGYLCSDGEPVVSQGSQGELFYEGFGNGPNDTTFNEAVQHVWEEGGNPGAEKSGPSGSEESSAPDGNRFARMFGPDGWICIQINAGGYQDLALQYEWRGDDQATVGDVGLTQYATGGTCAVPTGLTTLETHDMTHDSNPPWVTQNADISALDNSSFLLIFRAQTAGAGIDYRVDGIHITGTPI